MTVVEETSSSPIEDTGSTSADITAPDVGEPQGHDLTSQVLGISVSQLNFQKGELTLNLNLIDGPAVKDVLKAIGKKAANTTAQIYA